MRGCHRLPYTFGALLLEAAVPVAVVSRMMGHANEAITQSVYSHEIQRRESRERTRAGMQAAFGRRVVARRELGYASGASPS